MVQVVGIDIRTDTCIGYDKKSYKGYAAAVMTIFQPVAIAFKIEPGGRCAL